MPTGSRRSVRSSPAWRSPTGCLAATGARTCPISAASRVKGTPIWPRSTRSSISSKRRASKIRSSAATCGGFGSHRLLPDSDDRLPAQYFEVVEQRRRQEPHVRFVAIDVEESQRLLIDDERQQHQVTTGRHVLPIPLR